jgi:hypothetical protein
MIRKFIYAIVVLGFENIGVGIVSTTAPFNVVTISMASPVHIALFCSYGTVGSSVGSIAHGNPRHAILAGSRN